MSARLVLLAVDDEAIVLQTFARNLRGHFDIRVASRGEEALTMLEELKPDILLSDYAMPGMNGLELLERAAKLRPTMIRLLSTAHAGAPEVLEAQAKGSFRGLIEKPWTRTMLLAAIEKALAEPA
jgi:two-component system response regulator AtoC